MPKQDLVRFFLQSKNSKQIPRLLQALSSALLKDADTVSPSWVASVNSLTRVCREVLACLHQPQPKKTGDPTPQPVQCPGAVPQKAKAPSGFSEDTTDASSSALPKSYMARAANMKRQLSGTSGMAPFPLCIFPVICVSIFFFLE